MAVINNGFKPKFVDINLSNLSMDNKKIINSVSRKNCGCVYDTCARI